MQCNKNLWKRKIRHLNLIIIGGLLEELLLPFAYQASLQLQFRLDYDDDTLFR